MHMVYSTAPTDRATRTLVMKVSPLCRDAVGVLYSPNRQGHQDTRYEGVTPLQGCSWCVVQPQPTGPPGHSLWRSHPSAEMQLVYCTAPTDRTTRTLVMKVSPLCRDAVSVLYSPNRLGHLETRCKVLTTLQRCSWCILQPQQTGLD